MTFNRNLLILNGYNLHVTLEVVRAVMRVDLGIISLPSHTSHALQYVNVACFKIASRKPFKIAFRKHRNSWTLVNKKKRVGKQDLREWTSKALQYALTPTNIKAGFRKAGIWPLDWNVARDAMHPSVGFEVEKGWECDRGNGLPTLLVSGKESLPIRRWAQIK